MPPRVKAAANYHNSRLALLQARTDNYDTAILLYTPDTILLSILGFNYSQQASMSAAAVVGLLQTVIMVVWIGVAKLMLRPGGLHRQS